jgi:DMSO/TMAO reductase YedYZ molybdopterin-dependent catalytic subunit
VPNWTKIIEGKIRIAKRGAKPSRPSVDARIPPGQKEVTDFPVLDLGLTPDIVPQAWRLRLFGLVEQERSLGFDDLLALPQVRSVSDFHCVTRWSQLDLDWGGVLARDVIALAGPLAAAQFVTLHGADDYTTNLPLEALLDDDVLLAHSVLGKPLASEHGGPVRLVVPKRYGWKSAKWLTGVEFHEEDRPGFWEVRGYHNDADPWREERFSGGSGD